MQARYYNPAMGRFVSEDPVFVALPSDKLAILLADPQQWNSYAYGRNNPLAYRDPDGNIIETVVDVLMTAYDIGSFAFWGVQAIGSSAGIGLTHAFGNGPSTQLTRQADHAWGKLLNATINVGIDVVGTAVPFVPAVGLKAGMKAVDNTLDAGKAIRAGTEGVNGISGKAPDFVVSPGGTTFPVPKGAVGPVPWNNPRGKVTGDAFRGGRGGTNGQVDTMRIMNPTPPRGHSPGYPNGYVKYQNKMGQGVNPYTGGTGSRADTHFPID